MDKCIIFVLNNQFWLCNFVQVFSWRQAQNNPWWLSGPDRLQGAADSQMKLSFKEGWEALWRLQPDLCQLHRDVKENWTSGLESGVL